MLFSISVVSPARACRPLIDTVGKNLVMAVSWDNVGLVNPSVAGSNPT